MTRVKASLEGSIATVARLIADRARADEKSSFPPLLIFSLLGLLASIFAILNGIEIANF